MKYSVAALSLALGLASALSVSDLPSCSLPPLSAVLGADGCAGLTDFACHCGKSQLVGEVTPKVAAACSSSDAAKTLQVIQAICVGAGVPLGGGSASAGGSTSGSGSVSVSASSPVVTPPSNYASEPAYAVPTDVGAAATSDYGYGYASPTGSAYGSSSNYSSPVAFTGAAAAQAGVSGALVLAMAALYAF